MKLQFLLLLCLVLTGPLAAQDTIFVKGGQVIPAIIVEKNETEIKYRKSGQPGSAAIYSVFISDIASIHFQDGIIADYSSAGKVKTPDEPVTGMDMAGTMKAIKISLGISRGYFNRDKSDNLMLFWQNRVGTSNPIRGNTMYYPVSIKMTLLLGNSGRNWIGDELQLMLTPANAIYASSSDNMNQIKLRNFYSSIILFYGHTLNHKKNLALIIEPGLDIAFMSGLIKLNNKPYDVSGNIGTGFHIGMGADWNITKRFQLSARAGQRFMTIKEMHENSESKTGYSSFFVNPVKNDDLLTVRWTGPYASIGLSWSFYGRMKYGNAR